jgi:hypothetical protein
MCRLLCFYLFFGNMRLTKLGTLQGDGAKMTMQWFLPALLVLSALAAAEPRYPQSTSRPRHWQRGIRTLDDRAPSHFVG